MMPDPKEVTYLELVKPCVHGRTERHGDLGALEDAKTYSDAICPGGTRTRVEREEVCGFSYENDESRVFRCAMPSTHHGKNGIHHPFVPAYLIVEDTG
jgi:hypothetical protein